MVKVNRELVHRLRNQGKTFADIGRMFEVSRQYISAMYSGYAKIYARSDKHKMYKRHYKGHKKPSKPCEYCEEEATSTVSTASRYSSF